MSDDREYLAALLRAQGESEDDIEGLLPALARLGEWAAPTPSANDRTRLLAALVPLLAGPSLVRQAIQERRHQPGAELSLFLEAAQSQVRLLRPEFWVGSALISLLGMLGVFISVPAYQVLILRAASPLLAILTVTSIYRSARLGVWELEWVCLLSPVRLALARLVVTLSYDLALGLPMSMVLLASGIRGPDLLLLSLHWFAPLLLVAGATLVLSLWWPAGIAAAAAYTAWLLLLTPTLGESGQGFVSILLRNSEALMAGAGVVLLGTAVLRVRTAVPMALQQSWRTD